MEFLDETIIYPMQISNTISEQDKITIIFTIGLRLSTF